MMQSFVDDAQQFYRLESDTGGEYEETAVWLSGLNLSLGFIEVGSAWGASFHIWGKCIPTGPKISVDLPSILDHRLTNEVFDQRDTTWKQHFQDVHCIRSNSHDSLTVQAVADILKDDVVSFLFIDAAHKYEDVEADYLNYKRFVHPNGYIAFHDILAGHEADVGRFWNDLTSRNPQYSQSIFRGTGLAGIGVVWNHTTDKDQTS